MIPASVLISREYLLNAYDFIFRATPRRFSLVLLTPSSGWHATWVPQALVVLPESEDSDHMDALAAMFHEYGHFLDMERWIKENCVYDTSEREIVPTLYSNENIPRDVIDKYLRRRCPKTENVVRYHNYLLSNGIVEGEQQLDMNNLLKHEHAAWDLGFSGLKIGNRTMPGFENFVRDPLREATAEALIHQFKVCKAKFIATYENKFKE